jgi:osmotically-inducible protein OsmY
MQDARADTRVQREVLDELRQSFSLNPADVGVTVHDGVVTLTGSVDEPHQRYAAELATLRVEGVRAVANEISCGMAKSTDTQLARLVVERVERYFEEEAVDRSRTTAPGRVSASVSAGHVTLRGAVNWRYERTAIEQVLRSVPGASELTNLVEVAAPAYFSPAAPLSQVVT